MSKALDAIKNAQLVSIDYDGVLLQLIFNKPWKAAPKAITPPFPTEWVITKFFHKVRKAMPGAIKGVETLYGMKKEMVVLTARNPLTSMLAKQWMKAEGIDKYFGGFHNASFIEHMGEFKESIVKKLNVDIHIDDSVNIIRHLSAAFPQKTFIWLSSRQDDMKSLGFGDNVIHVNEWDEIFE